MEQTIGIIAAFCTILGISLLGGIFSILKNWEWIKNTLAQWTRNGIKVIYVGVSHESPETATLLFYLCGEEKSWLFSDLTEKDRSSHILAMKSVYYDPSLSNWKDTTWEEWLSQEVRPLPEEPFAVLVQLVGKTTFRFALHSDDELITVFDSFKFKTEISECKKKYRIKYAKKAAKPINRWKIRNRYPT